MTQLTKFLLAIFVATQIATIQSLPASVRKTSCGPEWYQYRDNGKCVRIFDEPMNFHDARAKCKSVAGTTGDLVSIVDPDMQNFVTAIAYQRSSNMSSLWIGLHKPNPMQYAFTDQSDFVFDNWALREPTHYQFECAYMNNKDMMTGKWYDSNCTVERPFICEKSPDDVTPSKPLLDDCQTIPNAPTGYKQFKDSCVQLFQKQLSFQAAESQCKSAGGHLMSLRSLGDQAMYNYLTSDLEKTWIGLTTVHRDAETSQKTWLDGSFKSYSNWALHHPTFNPQAARQCVQQVKFPVQGDLTRWMATPNCQESLPFMCRISPPKQHNQVSTRKDLKCPSGQKWVDIDESLDKCYWSVNSPNGNFNEASTHCQQLGGQLLTISNTHELNLVHNHIHMTYGGYWYVWLNMREQTGANGQRLWTTSSGKPQQFSNWDLDDAEPARLNPNVPSCAYMDLNRAGNWFASPCTVGRWYVCQAQKVSLSQH